jgi:hypothetical protein
MLPIYGVVVFGWDAFYIVVLYWAEKLVIGFYNILKIATAKVAHPIEHLGKLFLIPFFIVHFGGFVAVHGIFIFLIFGKDKGGSALNTGHALPCFLVFVQMLIGVIWHRWTTIPKDMKYVIVSLFLSYDASFVFNYLIAGAFLSGMIGSPAGVLIVLIVLKTIIDVKLHLRQHRISSQLAPQPV